MKNDRLLNRLALLLLSLTALVLACYLIIFLVPTVPLNPWPPIAQAQLDHPGAHPDAEGHTAADLDADGRADVSAVGHAPGRYACADPYAVGVTHANQESGTAHEVAV